VGSYVVDVYCPEAKLAVEVDGESHFDPASRIHDEKREEFLKSFGIRVLRFTNPEVYGQLDAVIEEIWRVANERIARTGNDPLLSPLEKGGGSAPLFNKEGVGGGRARSNLSVTDNYPPESPLMKGGGL